MNKAVIKVFTDVSCCPIQKISCYACVIKIGYMKFFFTHQFKEYNPNTNQHELQAIINALHHLHQLEIQKKAIRIEIYSDSRAAIGLINNNYLIKPTKRLLMNIKSKVNEKYRTNTIEFKYIKGHTLKKDENSQFNEKTHELAKECLNTLRKPFETKTNQTEQH